MLHSSSRDPPGDRPGGDDLRPGRPHGELHGDADPGEDHPDRQEQCQAPVVSELQQLYTRDIIPGHRVREASSHRRHRQVQ